MKWFSSLLLLLCGMWLGGCQQEDDFRSSAKTGFLITLTDEANQAYSRTAPTELEKPVASMFRLRVVDASTNKVAYSGKCAESVLVKEGTYNLTATYGENPVIGLDTPYYEGTLENQQVVTGQMTSASISCAVANALLSVNYDAESLKKVYEDYSVTVSVGDQSVELEAATDKSAYFQAGSSVKLVFHGHLAGTGQEVSYDIAEPVNPEKPDWKPFTNIPARTHVKIALGTNGVTSSGVGISVEKVEVSTVSVTETLPMEFMPKPKLESEGFVNNELSFAETEKKSAVINLNLSSPLQDMKLKFNSTDVKFEGLEADKEYFLSNADDKAAVETALGIALPEIGATEGSLDFTSLIPQLMTDAGNTVSSTIEVDVKANNRWASEDESINRVYTLKCNKPEFSIAVDERNCWSREFTIDEVNVTAGDPEAIKANLVYQYYDGSNWIDCATRESVKGRIQQFAQRAEDISNKVYKVRALYRGVIASAEAEATLETPVQLPNSGMEEWSIETKKKSGFLSSDKTYYTFHPYAEGNSASSWWDTNNNKAQGGTLALNIWYEGCFASCVSYTEDAHNGSKAALMYLSGCGDGAANTSGTYMGGAMVGSLFIGSYNSEIVQGHAFEARPMSMSFWYKYKPYNSDAFKVVVSLKNGDKEIATGVYEPASYSVEDNEYKQATVNFDYLDFYEKATIICVQFLASNKTSLSSSDFDMGTTITYPVIGDWTVHMGSILKIDDISLVYDK